MKLQQRKLIVVMVLKERETSLQRQGVARASAFLLVSLQVLTLIVEGYRNLWKKEELMLSFEYSMPSPRC